MVNELQRMWEGFWKNCGDKSLSEETKEGFKKLEKLMKELAENKEHQGRLRFLEVFDKVAMDKIKKEGIVVRSRQREEEILNEKAKEIEDEIIMKDTKQMTDDELKEEIDRLKNLIDETDQKTANIKENNDKQVLKIIELCEAIVSVSKVGP